jgi:hypothetical protein
VIKVVIVVGSEFLFFLRETGGVCTPTDDFIELKTEGQEVQLGIKGQQKTEKRQEKLKGLNKIV